MRNILIFFTIILIGCGKELEIIPIPPIQKTYTLIDTIISNQPFIKITGTINDSLYLDNNKSYVFAGKLIVGSDGILSIAAGTKMYAIAYKASTLIIERGGKLYCNGTVEKPVLFTSMEQLTNTAKPGDWVGIHINGNAQINDRFSSLVLEIGKYGRLENEKNDESSGLLKYVICSYAGAQLASSEGGLNLNGLGSNTELDYIQSINCKGNGIRIRGGTCKLTHIVSKNITGNHIRWEDGWQGKGQFWVAYNDTQTQDTITMIYGLNNLENDEPISNPILSNITINSIGTNVVRGIRLAEGTQGQIYNMIIANSDRAIRANDAFTNIVNGTLIVGHTLLMNNNINFYESTTSVANLFLDPKFQNIQDSIQLTTYIGVKLSGAKNPLSIFDGFTEANYIGAVNEANDWTKNWVQ
jgi:hypothetical protein